jgi:glycosyltransferase involved in cell wall biosynthesis
MRIALALPGLHRVNRGAETAFQSLGDALSNRNHDVTLFGTGAPRSETGYRFVQSRVAPRERFENWPSFPPLRSPYLYEELTWIPGFLRNFRPRDFDVTVTCSFPFTNLVLRTPRPHRPPHVFVTENGDWPAQTNRFEYRLFSCDGMVCTNAAYFERNKERWRSALIPNGVDLDRFTPGAGDRASFGIPESANVILMVSALNPNKRVDAGIRAVAALDDSVLVVAGDGPLRREIDALGQELLGDRFIRIEVDSLRMPDLYRSANVVLHTTKSESFGNVYVEALASGNPVVGHRSAHTEWILGDSPLLVDTTSIEDTTAALRRALDNSAHSAVAESAQRFSWNVVAEQYETFLETVIAQRKTS